MAARIFWLIALTTLPFFWFLTRIDSSLLQDSPAIFWNSLSLIVADIFGWIGTVLILWQFILGNWTTASLFGNDILAVNKLHRNLGIYGALFVFIHPILSMYAYGESLLWIFLPNLKNSFETDVTLGKFALILYFIIWISSALLRDKIRYRPWLYLHYLSYVLFPFIFLHAKANGSLMTSFPWLSTIWLAIFLIYIGILIIHILEMLGKLARPYRVTSVQHYGQTNSVLELVPVKQFFVPNPGQFVRVQLRILSLQHPYSILAFDSITGTISLGIKAVGSFSKELVDSELGRILNISPPYGVFTTNRTVETESVFLAGGIGITPFYRSVREAPNKVIILHSVKSPEDAVYANQFRELIGERYVLLASNQGTRLNGSTLSNILLKNNFRNPKFWLCGSPQYIEAIKLMLLEAGYQSQDIYVEEFGL